MSCKGTGRRNGRRTRLGAWARADYDEAGTVRRLTRASATAKRRLRRARDSDGGRRLRRWAPVAAIAALALAGAAMLAVGASSMARASTTQAQTAAMRREASQLRSSAGRPAPKGGDAGTPARKDKGGEAPAQDAVGEAERHAVQAATDAQNGPGDPSAAMQDLFPGVDRSRYQGFAISPLGRWNQGRTPCSWTGWPQDALGAGDHRVAFVCIAGDGHARGMASAVWTGSGFTDFDARINGVGAER